MHDSAGGLLLKKLKYFEAMLNIFELLWMWENEESWIAQPYFLTGIIKQSYYQLLFFAFKTFDEKKNFS